MPKSSVFLALFALLSVAATAQNSPADSLWIEAGNLRICLRADGSLYSGSPGGAVLYRHTTPQGEEKWTKVVQDAGLWFGGLDPGGNLLLSVQKFEPRATDFRAGFAGVSGSGKIWSVTHDQIEQHVADYSDNAHIDHPIEAIFAWPGRRNQFFEAYNGFKLLDSDVLDDNFNDLNSNLVYEPNKGEYPYHLNSGLDLLQIMPAQMHFFAFHTDNTSILANFWNKSMPFQAAGQIFTFDCDEYSVFENSFFTTLNWEHIGYELINPGIVGLYVNADIGNPMDDYHGCLSDAYFAYNATDSDSSDFEFQPPLLTVSSIASPLDHWGNEDYARMIPVWPSSSTALPAAMKFPQLPMEYYNFLSARWANGKPMTVGGNGYNFSNTDYTQQAFRGNPYTPGTWTEINAQNAPGDRRGLLSWDYQRFQPKWINRLMYITAVHSRDTTQTNEMWFDSIIAGINSIRLGIIMHDYDFMAPACSPKPGFSFPQILIRPYPNPVSEVLNLQIEGGEPQYIRFYNALGSLVLEQKIPCNPFCMWDNPVQLPIAHLPAGVYVVEVVADKTGERAVRKVVVH